MALSKTDLTKYVERLLMSRLRILSKSGFYGLLLMQIRFSVDEQTETAYTDAEKIVFGAKFLNELSDDELDFVMMHEIMHIALRHCFRGLKYDQEIFNIACDIVVNSNILAENNFDRKSITLREYGESMHIAPNKQEGYLFTAEEVYEMIINKLNKNNKMANGKNGLASSQNDSGDGSGNEENTDSWDDHSNWKKADEGTKEEWDQKIINAASTIKARDEGKGVSTLPLAIERLVERLKNPIIDWKSILHDFIQEDINDYSFSPPDRRFEESGFFLPDYNEKDESIKNILFMIDTSGSINSEQLSQAFSEIKGAIEQFNGKLSASLGFFDSKVYKPIPFETINDLLKIVPRGGGGTSFKEVFNYVNKEMNDNRPVSIIILTDGFEQFPDESVAMGTPVLWIINNLKVTPPWGRIARLIREH